MIEEYIWAVYDEKGEQIYRGSDMGLVENILKYLEGPSNAKLYGKDDKEINILNHICQRGSLVEKERSSVPISEVEIMAELVGLFDTESSE